jgi:transcriptional regulator with XRE-family HTH domain
VQACQVKEKLRLRRWSQADLARRVGCTPPLISLMLFGKHISPYYQTAIAQALGEDPQTLWGELWWFPRYARSRPSQRKESA